MTRRSGEPSTLYAPATAPGRAAVAVVRLSGPRAFAVATAVGPPLPPARRLALRRLTDPATGDLIDEALVAVFPAPTSFTGDDVAEFHLHGGALPTRRLLAAIARFDGLVAAAPGAFTRRAFLNGRLDLAQAEAIADLIAAETEAQRRQAVRLLDGAFGRRVAAWQARLIGLRAELEAGLDFADEHDVAAAVPPLEEAIAGLAEEVRAVLADDRGERLRAGLRIVVVGAPNSGKSSLVNALAKRDIAIVTAQPGTTRDLLEVALDVNGFPVTLVDTAGLRATEDVVEAEGIRRAREAAETADLRLLLLDGARWPDVTADCRVANRDLVVLAKADLVTAPPPRWRGRRLVPASVRCDSGLDELMRTIGDTLSTRLGGAGDPVWSHARHRDALAAALGDLEAAARTTDAVLRAESLRLSQRALATITGEAGAEALLDAIFSRFCIGK